MKTAKLSDMIRGWFVGNFEPTAYRTTNAEVAVKRYAAGTREEAHVHRIATELTVVVEGAIEMNGVRYTAGDIVTLEPGEPSDFYAVTDTVNVVVKIPAVPGDKYPIQEWPKC